MLKPRIIPCLLVHERGLVKTVSFREPKYVGDPINAVRIFNEKESDELMVLNIDASVHNQDLDYRMIEKLASECRMPLCYGGGIKTVEQAQWVLEWFGTPERREFYKDNKSYQEWMDASRVVIEAERLNY